MDSRKLVKATPKPLLLKDFLLDDFSSCSSSGFRSYPRRQCCTTVRFLVEIDMKKNNKQGIHKKKPLKLLKNPTDYPKSSPSSTKLSTFQKASLAVIKALKHFPFPKSLSTQNQTKTKLALLSKSLSKKLLKKTFWNKNELKEIEPWKKKKPEVVVVAESTSPEKPKPPISSPAKMVVVDSKSSGSHSSKKCESFSDSDFTVTTTSDNSCSNNFDTKGVNNVVLKGEEGSKEGDDIVGDDGESMEGTNSITNSEKASTSEEKEQFSPVSILDCPFADEDEVSSPFRHRLTPSKETSKRLTKKLQWFERHAQVEPVNLEKKMVESPEVIASSESEQNNFMLDEIEEEECVEEEALKLLQLLKDTTPSQASKQNTDTLAFDFFREKLTFYGLGQGKVDDRFLLNSAIDWINGVNNGESTWDWKIPRNRQAYVREMEMGGEWKNMDEDNIEGIALELEDEVFTYVVDELLGSLVE